MTLTNKVNPHHRLSMRLDDGFLEGSSRVSTLLNDGFPKNNKFLPSIKEQSELQITRGKNIHTDDPQFTNSLMCGIPKDCNELLSRSLVNVKLFEKKTDLIRRISGNFRF